MGVYGNKVAADGSDIIAVQKYPTAGSNTNVVVRGFPIDQGGYVGGASTGLSVANTQVGYLSGNH